MEAKKRERALTKFRETNGLSDQVNVDLTYAVDFNLAVCYHANKDYQEALDHFTGVDHFTDQDESQSSCYLH